MAHVIVIAQYVRIIKPSAKRRTNSLIAIWVSAEAGELAKRARTR